MSSAKKSKVLVIGDAMIDRYVYVTSDRRAQEADVPVWDVRHAGGRPGGALNVAANVSRLGDGNVDVYFAGIARDDALPFLTPFCYDWMLVSDETMVKTRYVLDHDIVARVDSRRTFSRDAIDRFQKTVLLMSERKDIDCVVVSDYDKGTITPDIARVLCQNFPMVIVDSKRRDLSPFRGATVLNVNLTEYSLQVSQKQHVCVEELFGHVVVTNGAEGSELRMYDRSMSDPSRGRYVVHTEKFPTRLANAVDVTGCGDVHTAAVAVQLLKDASDMRTAVRFGNECATGAVEVFGTTIVSPD